MHLQNINPHFITDTSGNKVYVVLSMDEYNTIMEELEELEDIINYDKAKLENDVERILLSDI
jgi:PHD/YefM family antitoxin component YafN of YafNO toxin-antitoxin module